MDLAGKASIRENYEQVLEQISRSARRAGRDASEVKLVVVTKGHPLEVVQEAVEAGARCFGENYAEEGAAKIGALGRAGELEWHMIGHIQSRKARIVCEHFDFVHSLDSWKLAERLDRFAAETGKALPVLLECNMSGEASKFGWRAWDEENWPALETEFARILELANLEVRGLMTMAPFFFEPESARPYFRNLRRLRNQLVRRLPGGNWNELSMGMSGDYEVAIQEGATMVRIGTAILGARQIAIVKNELGGSG